MLHIPQNSFLFMKVCNVEKKNSTSVLLKLVPNLDLHRTKCLCIKQLIPLASKYNLVLNKAETSTALEQVEKMLPLKNIHSNSF